MIQTPMKPRVMGKVIEVKNALEIDRLLKYPHRLGWYLGYRKLSEIHSEWIRYLFETEGDSSLQAHRNSYKTTACIIVGTIWHLIQNPEDRVLILREEATNASRTLQAIMGLYESSDMRYLYKEIHGVNVIRTERWNTQSLALSTKLKKTPEGNIEARGITGSITGSHYERILADDIITDKDRYFRSKRELTKRVIMELENIKTSDGKIQSTGTPWHPDDAHQYLPTPKRFPAFAMEIKGFTKAKYEHLKKNMSASLFAANYELNHISDENRIFSDPIYEGFPEGMSKIAVIDPAYSGKNNTAIAIGGKYGELIYCTGFSWRKAVDQVYKEILDLLKKYDVGTLYVEANADKGMSAKELKTLRGSGVQPYYEGENKHMRIINNARGKWHMVRFEPDVQNQFITNILEYEEGVEPDDEADALAGLIRKLTKKKVKPGLKMSRVGL